MVRKELMEIIGLCSKVRGHNQFDKCLLDTVDASMNVYR